MYASKQFYFVLLLLWSVTANAQIEDSNFIGHIRKSNNVELNNYYNSTRLHFESKGNAKDAFNFFANNGLFSGVYLNYKWLTFGYGIIIPFTSRDNSVKGFKIYQLHFTNYKHGWGFAGSAEVYKGLLSQTYKNLYLPVDGVKYTNITTDFFHVANAAKYSYKAAQNLSEQQFKNAGSVFYHIRLSYYALNVQNTSSAVSDSVQSFLSRDPNWLSLIGTVGYGYNFIWKQGKWMISPRAEAGAGLLYQFGIDKRFKPASFFRTAFTTGYNTQTVYTYLSIETINTANFFSSTKLSDDRLRLNYTLGYRLASLKKKILGVL